MPTRNKTPWLFYALVVYVLMQFLWWEVLLARQSKQLSEERKKIIALNITDKDILELNLQEIDQKRNHQLWMHVGEGTVFLILLTLGVLKIYNTRKKENELNRLQSNFLLSVTHELRSPLASVKLQLQTLQKHKLDEGTKNSLLQKAVADNERLMRLIDNILLASRSGNERPALNKTKINLDEFLYRIHEETFAKDKGRITLHAKTNHFFEADEGVLSIILSNLVENALKYSPRDTHVDVKAITAGQETIITISDNGPGISDEEKKKVFDKFYRVGNEETRSAKGTGLGLYIVKDLCNLHNIRLSLSDNKPNGLIFELRI
jgi:signal transduction histidine kinase